MSASRAVRCAIRQSCPRPISTTHLSQPAPLFLDFLAPTWHERGLRALPLCADRRHLSTTIRVLPQSDRRHLSTTTRVLPKCSDRRYLSTTIRRQATAITNPRTDDEGKEMSIIITPRAEQRLKAIAEKDSNPQLALRVSVESGGCHGFQYLMKLINTSDIDAEEDTVFENTVADDFKARVVMDEPSLELLKGSNIDYTMELIGSQFKVTGIPGAKSSCGCGTSFDIAS